MAVKFPGGIGSVNLQTTAPPPTTNIPAYYQPASQTFIFPDAPNVIHTGIDIEYKFTAYDWFNRAIVWTVESGPAGMVFDLLINGLLRYTPDTDSTDIPVIISAQFGGAEKVFSAFTMRVENSRCYFIATDGDDVNPGTELLPVKTIDAVIALVGSDTDGKTIYFRAGDHIATTDQTWATDPGLSPFHNKDWNDGDAIMWRNYPGETVTRTLTSTGQVFRMFGENIQFQGINGVGGNASETGQWNVGLKQTCKICTSSGFRRVIINNPHGFHVAHGGLLDWCTSWDNNDPASPLHLNNSNFGIYMENSALGEKCYLIECIGDGLSTYDFKVKKSGVEGPVIHNFVSTGPGGCEMFQNRQSIRYGWINSTDREPINIGGGSAVPGATDEGGLVENCLLISNADTRRVIWQQDFAFGSTPSTPSWVQNNILVSKVSTADSMYKLQPSGGQDPLWTMVWMGNQMYTPSPSDAVNLLGVVSSLATLDNYGTGNVELASLNDLPLMTKTVQDRTFQFDNGVFSEL